MLLTLMQKFVFEDLDEYAKCTQENDVFNKNKTLQPTHHVGLCNSPSKGGCQPHGSEVPMCYKVAFRPSKDIRILDTELMVATYIFGQDFENSDILVDSPHCNGSREAFKTLVPGSGIIDDVLILVAEMMTNRQDNHKWFLPPGFAQIAIQLINVSSGTLSFKRQRYMPKFERLEKFLMIIDLVEHELVYLDSLKSNEEKPSRVQAMKDVACFLGGLIDNELIYDNPMPISKNELAEPKICQQKKDTLDCGIWVSQWITMSNVWDAQDLEEVNEYSRMRLAIDLVLNDYNPKREEIVRTAMNAWNIKSKA
ncbi:hypothetical protein PIB30_093944 [Stylosanthes scabra]|uniref:Ubiquitin-like protease family profile domain-containing protein n=1 Tax=Stylosanthes scabra TaxID=79078 RepID=A0ABU6UUT0_9FABA|nr:hypothetical protein [Stylosanthes scabra]